MISITSTQNEKIRRLRALKEGKERAASGLFLVEGKKLCEEAQRDLGVDTLLVEHDLAPLYAGWRASGDKIEAPAHVVASACEAKAPQGIVCAVKVPPPLRLEEAKGALLVMDGVQDPGNVGTMLRTAEAAGFCGALLSPACADAFAPKTVRASMGSVLRLPVWRGELQEALFALKESSYTLISAELGGEPLRAGRMPKDFALIIGSEGGGVSPGVSALADCRVSLPMRGRAESLNAAVAAGILMYLLTGDTPCS